jgi:hypothetical protein
MKSVDLSILELMFVAATRGIAGVGIGLLVADHLGARDRRNLGIALLGIGLVTTVPIAARVFGERRLLAD